MRRFGSRGRRAPWPIAAIAVIAVIAVIAAARRRSAAAVLAPLAMAVGACAPALDWREVRPPGTAVSATMPCKPNVSTRTVTLAGQSARLTLLACKAGELTWALAAAELADPGRVGPALAALSESTRANLGGEVVASKPVAVRGATPHAAQASAYLRGRRPDGRAAEARTLVFSHGTQVFQAVVLGPQVPVGPSATFFDSLRAGA